MGSTLVVKGLSTHLRSSCTLFRCNVCTSSGGFRAMIVPRLVTKAGFGLRRRVRRSDFRSLDSCVLLGLRAAFRVVVLFRFLL